MSQDYGNARYTMAKCTHVLRTYKLAKTCDTQQSMTANRPDTVFKTTVQCVHHSLELLPSVCQATDQWTC